MQSCFVMHYLYLPSSVSLLCLPCLAALARHLFCLPPIIVTIVLQYGNHLARVCSLLDQHTDLFLLCGSVDLPINQPADQQWSGQFYQFLNFTSNTWQVFEGLACRRISERRRNIPAKALFLNSWRDDTQSWVRSITAVQSRGGVCQPNWRSCLMKLGA